MNQPERNNESGKKTNSSRRRFLKFGLAGAGAAAVVAGGLTAIKRMEGIPQKEFPFPTNKKFKPLPSARRAPGMIFRSNPSPKCLYSTN